jgi:hypothetical protein
MPPSTAKAQIIHCDITVSVAPAVLKTKIQIKPRRQISIA